MYAIRQMTLEFWPWHGLRDVFPCSLVGEEHAEAEQVRACPSVHLALEHRDVAAGLVRARLLPLPRLVSGLGDQPFQVGDLAGLPPAGEAALPARGALVGGQAHGDRQAADLGPVPAGDRLGVLVVVTFGWADPGGPEPGSVPGAGRPSSAPSAAVILPAARASMAGSGTQQARRMDTCAGLPQAG
jgi:hypothetical protein